MTSKKLIAPPHSLEAEQAVLACVLNEPEHFKQIANKPLDYFHDLRHATIFETLKALYKSGTVINMISVEEKLRGSRQLKEAGGLPYMVEVDGKHVSAANLPYYLSLLHEKYSLRKLQIVCRDSDARITNGAAGTGEIKSLIQGIEADLATVSRLAMPTEERRALKVWNSRELADYVIPADMQLVGDNEVVKGYEGVTVLAGPGSSGKSLATMALALAGARGTGFWMGRKVHRQFKTLIIQAENGLVRLKSEFEHLKRNHPELPLDDFIFISEPPEGGLPFHRNQFRTELRKLVDEIKPDLVIVDPWSQVATEDAAKEVVDKLAEIRSCFPADNCPGLIIVAHTKKPRAEDVRKGRGLVFLVSGSIALVNTARCVYMLLPWTDDPEDDRIYWSCPKLNNGAMYAPSVWHRKFGTFFVHDEKTNPKDFGKTDDERESITEDHLRAAFEKSTELKSGDLVKKLQKSSGAGESTCWRAIGEDGYLRVFLMRSGFAKVKLKDPTE